MLSNAKTPNEYIEQLDHDWRRETLLALRDIIKAKGPALEERINYKMLGYGDAETEVFHLNVQKAYVSLYVGNAAKIDPGGTLLAGLNVGKGCIRFKKTDEIADTKIEAFIGRAIELWQRGEDVAC